jgi:hypothetical protein
VVRLIHWFSPYSSLLGKDQKLFLLQDVPTGFGAYLASFSVGNRGSSPDVKQPNFEADHYFNLSSNLRTLGRVLPLPICPP